MHGRILHIQDSEMGLVDTSRVGSFGSTIPDSIIRFLITGARSFCKLVLDFPEVIYELHFINIYSFETISICR